MLKNKNKVRAFIYDYMDLASDNLIKALGFIKYYTFDKDKINSDEEKIFRFFMDSFDLSEEYLTYDTMLLDKNDNKWLEIEDIYDLMLLDELLAFAIASGVFIEDLMLRSDINAVIYCNALLEEPENLQNYSEEEYLDIMKNKLINALYMHVNLNKIMEYNYQMNGGAKCVFNDEEKRDLLLYWWDSNMDSDDFTEERIKFVELLNSASVELITSFIATCYAKNTKSSFVAKLIRSGRALETIKDVVEVQNLDSELSKELREVRIKMLKLLYAEQQKKKRLS